MSWRKNQKIKYSFEKNSTIIPEENPLSTDEWKTNTELKDLIKTHYSIIQDDLCAYCRTYLRINGYGEPIEHIVPKSDKLKWMFHPKNLCLSCYGCNTKKGTKNTLVNISAHTPNSYTNYPTNSSDFNIIHPHFDSYSVHIIEENLICKPRNNSNKGAKTIEVCELNRLDLIYTRARIKKKSKKEMNSLLALIVADSSNRAEEIDSAKKMIENIIFRYNYFKSLVS
jgi:uncharacterized protein (TIGR02646 family)